MIYVYTFRLNKLWNIFMKGNTLAYWDNSSVYNDCLKNWFNARGNFFFEKQTNLLINKIWPTGDSFIKLFEAGTNTPAYYNTELITAVISFIVQAPRANIMKLLRLTFSVTRVQCYKTFYDGKLRIFVIS